RGGRGPGHPRPDRHRRARRREARPREHDGLGVDAGPRAERDRRLGDRRRALQGAGHPVAALGEAAFKGLKGRDGAGLTVGRRRDSVSAATARNRMRFWSGSTLVGALLVFSATGQTARADEGIAAAFAYPVSAPLDLKEVGVEKREGATVHDMVFAANPGAPAAQKAYLVVPEGKGPFAGVLWVHWLGDPATTNRTQYLAEA